MHRKEHPCILASLQQPRSSWRKKSARGEPVDQPDRPIRRAQQQAARLGRNRAAIERGDHGTPFDACKSKPIGVTLCRHREPPLNLIKSLSQNNFLRFVAPMHLPFVRNPG
jgi:hypothetical protein